LTLLFHRLRHQKQRMFAICAEVVDARRKGEGQANKAAETTNILNELLANDQWLEQVFIC